MTESGDNLDFDKLMCQIRDERCQNAFHKIFDSFYGKIAAYFKKSGIDSEKATELAQETLFLVWNKASFFDPRKGSFQVWIFTVARNLKFDHLRSIQKNMIVIDSESVFQHLEDSSLQNDLPQTLQEHEIERYLNTLTDEQKQAIEAMYFEGYSQSEYADRKKIPLGTVKSRIRLALANLKKAMEGQ